MATVEELLERFDAQNEVSDLGATGGALLADLDAYAHEDTPVPVKRTEEFIRHLIDRIAELRGVKI